MFLSALDPVRLPFDKSQPLSGLSRKLPECDRKGIDRGGRCLLPSTALCPRCWAGHLASLYLSFFICMGYTEKHFQRG